MQAHAPVLADVAARAALEPQEEARRHAGTEYHVYLLGFLPGFYVVAVSLPVLILGVYPVWLNTLAVGGTHSLFP